MKHKNSLCSLLVATFATATAPAYASDADQLEEVVVTAQRRPEDIQKVPVQVQAFSSEQLASADVRNTQQLLNLVPNVNLAHSYTFLNSFVTIRGISEINNAASPLAVIVDGVPQNNQKQLLMDLFDVQQVEVLMGPQGGLYGRNAIGGAMIITTEQPTNEFKTLVDVSYGNGNAYETEASVSGPIIDDKLLFSLAGNVQGSGGLIKNPYLDTNVDAVNHDDTARLRLIAYPTSWLTLDLRGDYNNFKGGAIWDSVVFSGNPNQIEPPVSDFRGATTGDVGDATFKFDADLGFATLTGITGYTNLTEDNRGSLDFTNPIVNPGGFLGMFGPVGQGQNLSTSITSQELRLVSPGNQPLRWIVGSYYAYTNRWLLTRAFLEIPPGSDQFDNPALTIINRDEHDQEYSTAFYAQADYDITQSLTVLAAFRYDTDRIEQTNEATPGIGQTVQSNESSPEPKATITYHFDSNALGYATYSTGFRAGGFNAPNIAAPYTEFFMPEKLTNYEVGFKTSWLDQALIVNGAYYYAIDHNYQFFFVNASDGSQVIQNLNLVHIDGIELNAQAVVAHGLKLFGGLGTTHTNIVESTEFPTVVGNKTPKTIPWSLKLGVQYDRPLGNDVNGTIRVDYTHDAKEYWQIDNLAIQKSLDLVNLRAGIEFHNWGVYLWGKNLTNERYYEDYNPSKYTGLPYDLGSLAEPLTYGIEFKAHF
jgi:iron complex outermembrane receptor protein